MKKRTLLYIPLLLLAAFAFSALAVHYSNIFAVQSNASAEFIFPFTYNKQVVSVRPEGEAAGIKIGDRIEAINGRLLTSDEIFQDEFSKLQSGQPVSLTMQRKTADGGIERLETTIQPHRFEKDFNYYSRQIVGFLFVYVLPTFCILLGFWVVFARPRDPLAWVLLFVLLGLSSLGLETYPSDTFVGIYQDVFFSAWALAMLLFGIYFPERWSVDRKLPWLKWIFIVPLAFQIFATLLGLIRTNSGLDVVSFLKPLTDFYNKIVIFVNLSAISIFFAALGHKSGTTKNPDARRRLRLMLYGTAAAMMPSFLIVIYRIFSGAQGSFFEIVPFWVAILALVLMLLFPLTMAYVIVVHRAMDVRVVVRQGLQYAFAKNGVLVLQILLSSLVILTALSFVTGTEANRPQRITFIALGVTGVFVIRLLADKIRIWIDRKFFREAYNAEQILSDLSEQVRTMVETKPLLEMVSTRISESLHVPQIALLLKNSSHFQPAHALGYEIAPTVGLSEDAKIMEKLKRNEPLIVYQDEKDSWINEELDTEERENLQKLNSQLLLPVGAKDELSGIISLSPKKSEEPYTPNDLRLLRSVATQTGLALENSRLTETIAREAVQRERINRELEIAREVQERLFPQELPKVEGLDYFGACRPALGVGGDYYDFLELPEGKFGIAIGDISGKGIGASLMMASLQASLRGQSIHFKDDLASLMKQINSLLYEASTSNRYATFFYSQYDPKTRKLIYVNAGHNPPFLIRKKDDDFEVLKLEEGGAVVGMLPSDFVFYKQGEIELQPGDLLVGFTDGISEAMNPNEEEWGEDAMLEEIKRVTEKPAEEILNYIVERADEFANGANQHDDMTMILIKVRGEK
ncbi:MAG TPA: SpoIIE family protein phosphatase [Pyrinomonadaceae bacterium]|nr:SpoIIE family protein phosphatase [Pyrinomonadaceae bacterium]